MKAVFVPSMPKDELGHQEFPKVTGAFTMILSPQFMMQAARLSSKVCGTILLIVENPRLGMRKMGIMT